MVLYDGATHKNVLDICRVPPKMGTVVATHKRFPDVKKRLAKFSHSTTFGLPEQADIQERKT
jgi:hypothetical protein